MGSYIQPELKLFLSLQTSEIRESMLSTSAFQKEAILLSIFSWELLQVNLQDN